MEESLKQKKVLYIITKSNFGGAQRYVYELALANKARGCKVAVACGGIGELVEKLNENGIETFLVTGLERDLDLLKEIKAIYSLAKIIRDFDPDIVHANSTKAGGIGTFLARILFVPKIIFTAHGWPFLEPRSRSWKLMAFAGSYATAIFAHEIILVSRNDFKHTNMPGVKSKLNVIHTAVASFPLIPRDEARLKLLPQEVIDQHFQNIWLITNAELNHNKNHTAAIDAVAEFNSQHATKIFYVIIGAGDSEATLKDQVELRSLSEYVYFCGYKADARQYLLAFDIFLLPSKKEGLPYALLEAGLAQIPCIASNTGGISEVITDKESGLLINPDNHMSIVMALNYLLTNPDERSHFADALYQNIKRDFSLKQMIEKTNRVYDL
jgi:glycosyltransferase involved in cell wall biosynthesis